MEVVPLGSADEIAALAADVFEAVVGRNPAAIILGGGITDLGDPLLAVVTDALRAQAAASPFLAAINLADRVRLLPAGVPAAAIGAAMIWDAR